MLKLIATGHLGQNAIVRQMQSGNKVINFSIAHNERYTDKQGVSREKTTWIECAYWLPNPDNLVKHLLKGTQVVVEGEPSADAYAEKASGELRSKLRLRVRSLDLMGSSNGNKSNAQVVTPAVQPNNPATNWHPAAQTISQQDGPPQYGDNWYK